MSLRLQGSLIAIATVFLFLLLPQSLHDELQASLLSLWPLSPRLVFGASPPAS